MANEDNLKPFKKGKDPRRNTTGKNKGGIHLKRKLKETLCRIHKGTGTRYDELFIDATVKDAIKEDGASRKLIWQYLEGMPKQSLEVDGSLDLTTVLQENLKQRNEESNSKD